MGQHHSDSLMETHGRSTDPGIAGKVRDQVESQVREARETAAAAQQQAADTFEKGRREGTRFVHENPGLAIAAALGAGVLIGLALRGRP